MIYEPIRRWEQFFDALITDRQFINGQWQYAWSQQIISENGGLTDVDQGLSGTTTVDYAVEVNGQEVQIGSYVFLRPRGFNQDQQTLVFEFACPAGVTGSGGSSGSSGSSSSSGSGAICACPTGTWNNYRSDCISGLVYRFRQVVDFLNGALTVSPWFFDSFQGCCDCGSYPEPSGSGSSGSSGSSGGCTPVVTCWQLASSISCSGDEVTLALQNWCINDCVEVVTGAYCSGDGGLTYITEFLSWTTEGFLLDAETCNAGPFIASVSVVSGVSCVDGNIELSYSQLVWQPAGFQVCPEQTNGCCPDAPLTIVAVISAPGCPCLNGLTLSMHRQGNPMQGYSTWVAFPVCDGIPLFLSGGCDGNGGWDWEFDGQIFHFEGGCTPERMTFTLLTSVCPGPVTVSITV